jgi:hypothetical protein
MKRLLLLLLAYAVGGAIINVAVAWGCAIRQYDLGYQGLLHPLEDETDEAWLQLARADWMPAPHTSFKSQRFGACEVYGTSKEKAKGPPMGPPMYNIGEVRAGWPMLTLRFRHQYVRGDPPPRETYAHAITLPSAVSKIGIRYGTRLPLFPLWPGFTINTIFYAAILWLLFAAPRFVRRRIRARRGQCPACAYPVGASTVCTECGRSLR